MRCREEKRDHRSSKQAREAPVEKQTRQLYANSACTSTSIFFVVVRRQREVEPWKSSDLGQGSRIIKQME
jgi:hypothetical protein